jgi:chemotaxis protein methyltransferase CheR
MYFTPAQIGNVIAKLRHSLVDGGWMAVSPSEGSKALFPNFTHVNFPGAIFFQKNKKDCRHQSDLQPLAGLAAGHQEAYLESIDNSTISIDTDKQNTLPGQALSGETRLRSSSIAEVLGKLQSSGESLYLQGLYSEVTDTLLAGFAKYPIERHLTSPVFSLMARALANQGMLNDALVWCDRWITADKVNVAAHYLRGVILLEQGKAELASSCFQRALYLQPDFALAHFSLGSLAHNSNKLDEAFRHFANALKILGNLAAEEVLPESEGLTAGRLIEFINSMQALELAK